MLPSMATLLNKDRISNSATDSRGMNEGYRWEGYNVIPTTSWLEVSTLSVGNR